VPVHAHAGGRGGAVRPDRDPARGADPGGGHDGGAAPGGGRRYGGTGGDLPEAHGSGGRGGAHRGAASRAGAGMMGGASTTGGARPAVVDAGMGVLLGVKVRLARRRAGQASSIGRAVILGFVGLAFWALLYGVIHRLLDYFRSTPGIGDLLAAKLLGLLLL